MRDDRKPKLNVLWAGKLFGTNTGNLFAKIAENKGILTGTLRLADDNFGIAVFDLKGTFEDGEIKFSCNLAEAQPDISFGEIAAKATLSRNGSFNGEWESSIGTGGTFELFPHSGSTLAQDESSNLPEQVYSTVRDFGPIRFYKDDILELIGVLQKHFHKSRVVVTHLDRGAEVSRFSNDFEPAMERIESLNFIRINVQESDGSGIDRSATIDLGKNYNRITTRGADESWVLGELQTLSTYLVRREHRFFKIFGKYRIGLNQIVALAALVAMPDLPLQQRAIFLFTVIGFLVGAHYLQGKLIPNVVIEISKKRPNWFIRSWPSIVSWMISATAGVAASVAYGLLK